MITDYLERGEWHALLKHEFENEYFRNLLVKLTQAYNEEVIFPPKHLIFSALNRTSYEQVKVVILGQDPYHQTGQAHGLAFSVTKAQRVPPSLRNIYRELHEDLGCPIPNHGNLEYWASQGVLLLNSSLTVSEDRPGSHRRWGWEAFTNAIVSLVSQKSEPVVFMIWGNHAKTKLPLIQNNRHLILQAAHPSPLSAHRGFFGCAHFSQANKFLIKHGLNEVDWTIPD